MITNAMIKECLKQIKPGTTFTLAELQEHVSRAVAPEDLDVIHTDTRATTYPKWKHRLQAVLHEMKTKGSVTHVPSKLRGESTYTFL